MLAIIQLKLKAIKGDLGIIIGMAAMALFLTFIFGSAFSSDYKPTFGIVNQDQTVTSNKFLKSLEDGAYHFKTVEEEMAIKDVSNGKYVGAFIIPEGFEKRVLNNKKVEIGYYKLNDSMTSVYARIFIEDQIATLSAGKVITNELSSFLGEEILKSEDVESTVLKKVKEGLRYQKAIKVSTNILESGDSTYHTLIHSIFGFTLFFSMFAMTFCTGEIADEKENKTWHRMLVSPLRPQQIILGNMIYGFLIGLFQISIILVGGKYLFSIDFGEHLGQIMILASAFIFCVTAFGFFLGSCVKTHQQLSAIIPLILTASAMLGGCMWPLEIVSSKVLLLLAKFVPQYWALKSMKDMVLFNSSLSNHLDALAVLLLMGCIYLGIGVKRINKSL